MEQYLNIITRRNVEIPQYVRDKFPDIMVVLQGNYHDNYICHVFRSVKDDEIAALNKAVQDNQILQYDFSVIPEININVSITYKQWMQFQKIAQEDVDAAWNGDYEAYAASIMSAHIKTYVKTSIKKQERRIERERERLKQEREMNI